VALNAATGGQDVSTVGTSPIPPGNAVVAGTQGAAFTALGAQWNSIVTNLVIKNVIENLRKKAVFAQPGNRALNATHIPGTNAFVYTAFGDLPPAVSLLEGVPPQTVLMTWSNDTFQGAQKGQVVAITDLAEIFSPFDLWSQAADKIAWNATEAMEVDILAALNANNLALTLGTGGYTKTLVNLVTQMKRAEIPRFEDGTYHAFIAPETSQLLQTETGELGWTDVSKYADPSAIMRGEVGMYRGVRFIETTRMTGGSADVIAFGPEAWAQGDFQTIRPYRVTGADHADPLDQRGTFGWKGMWGVKALKMAAAIDYAPASNTFLQRVAKGTLAP